MLAPTDYEITEAENGEQALTAIATAYRSREHLTEREIERLIEA